MHTPSRGVDTLTDGVTLRPCHVRHDIMTYSLLSWYRYSSGRGLWNVFFTARRM